MTGNADLREIEVRERALQDRAQNIELAVAWILEATDAAAPFLRGHEKAAQHFRYHVTQQHSRSPTDRTVALDYTEMRLNEIGDDLRDQVAIIQKAIDRGILGAGGA